VIQVEGGAQQTQYAIFVDDYELTGIFSFRNFSGIFMMMH
jgi:hypothetical protein